MATVSGVATRFHPMPLLLENNNSTSSTPRRLPVIAHVLMVCMAVRSHGGTSTVQQQYLIGGPYSPGYHRPH
jgi:hypothetical protein